MRRTLTSIVLAILATPALGAQTATRKPPVSQPLVSSPSTKTPPARPAAPAASAKTVSTSQDSAVNRRVADPSASRWRWASVTYLSGETIYLDAGTMAGLREKAVVEVMRRDSVVASLEVQFVSSSRSATRAVRGAGVAIGDSARFLPAVETIAIADGASAVPGSGASAGPGAARDASGRASVAAAQSGALAPSATASASASASSSASASASASASSSAASGGKPRKSGARTVSGRVGVRYLSLQTGTGASGRVTQPAVDMRLEGHRIDGTPFGLVIDARAHRQQAGSGKTTGSTRVYQSSLEYQGVGPFPVRVTAGRQLSNVLSSLGFFDGVTLDVDRKNWRVGAVGGTQPDYTNFQPSGAIREGGAWLQWHTAPGSHTIFQTTVGGVGSYGVDGINREFALLSSMLVTPKLSWYATQEIDVNRGWRKSAESGQGITPTSTFATLRVAVSRALSVQAGYDSRRSVRLYRDFLTPDVAFDDAFRKGYWGGLSLSVPHVFASADVRTSDGATVGRNQSNTASLSVTRLTKLGFGLRARGTTYDGPTVSGTLTSASFEIDPWGRARIEATVGRRDDRRAQSGMLPARTTWVGFDADAGIGRSWYIMASSYREVGATERLLQQYLGLSWRY